MRPATSLKVALAALALGAGVTYFLPSLAVGADSIPGSNLQIEPTATLEAKGAAVELRLSCAPEFFQVQTYVQVTERSGNGIAQGSNYATVTCTGEPQPLLVIASTKPFHPGTAIVQLSGYYGSSATTTVRIVNR